MSRHSLERVGVVINLLLLAVALTPATPGWAQASIDTEPGSAVRTRSELQELAEVYQRTLESPAYSESMKSRTRTLLARVRQRLEEGDFRLGDRIAIVVQGEPELSDTVTVQSGPRITLPILGDISLRGVLRSEVEEHLTEEVGRFLREPVVRASALMRVSVLGGVGSPGFYIVPAEMLLSETIMVAGGPAQSSGLDGIRIERGADVVMEGREVSEAIREGMTLDQLNLQAGDQVVVPEAGTGFWGRLGILGGVASTVTFLIIRIF